MKRVYLVLSILLMNIPTLSAMKVSCRITFASPTTIVIEDVQGNSVFYGKFPDGKREFETDEMVLLPDVYRFRIGDASEWVFLDGTDVKMSGYLDPSDPEKSALEIEGISLNEKFTLILRRYKDS